MFASNWQKFDWFRTEKCSSLCQPKLAHLISPILSFYLPASDVLSHSFFTESSIFSLKLALSVEKNKKNRKKLKSHGKCSRSTGNCCARFPLGLDLYTSADLNNNFTWGQAKNLVFSPRVAAADLLNKSEQTNQLLLKFPVAHGQWVTPMQWHSSLIGILHYYW